MNTCARLVLLIVGGIVILLEPSSAWAHAVPRTTLPTANAVMQEAPHEITIRFSERVEPRASSLQVLDSLGRRLDDGTATVVPDDPWLYHVTLPAFAAGVYTVSWRVMSADDGHVTEGTYARGARAGAATTVVMDELVEMTCPRCGATSRGRFYGPCDHCRAELRAALAGEAVTSRSPPTSPR